MTKRSNRQAAEKQVKAAYVDKQAQEDHQMDTGIVKFNREPIILNPKTDNQKKFVADIKQNDVSVGIGPAGVGKTYCTATVAAQMLATHQIDKIILTRANVTVGASVGMLPGTVEEKMTPLLLPMLSVLKRQLGDRVYEYCLRKKKIEMLPFEYVRGNSYKDTFVIVDEAQNLKENDVVAICTRFESGHIVLLGDPFQHDMERVEPGITWLKKFVQRNKMDIPITEFGLEDIVRSGFVRKFLEALYAEKAAAKKLTTVNG